MKKLLNKIAWSDVKLSAREHVIILLLIFSITPFYRGGRDPLGLLVPWGCLLVAVILLFRVNNLKWRPPPTTITVLVGLFISWQWLSLIWSQDLYASTIQNLFWLGAILTAGVALVVLSDKKRRIFFVRYALLAAAVISVIGYIMFVNIPFDRATSLFYWPNPLALYLLIAMVLGVYEFWRSRSYLTLSLLFIVSGAFVLTESLATFALAILAATFLVLINKDKRRHILDMLVIIIAGVLLSLTLKHADSVLFPGQSIGTPDAINELIELKTSGVSDRFDFWQGAFSMWNGEDRVVGSGLESFSVMYPRYQLNAGLGVANPHNIYVQQLAETGIIGITLLLGMIASLLAFIWKNRKRTEVLVAATVIGLWLLHAGFYQTNRYPTLIAWLLVAIVYMTAVPATKKLPKQYLTALVLIILVALLPAYSKFTADYHSRLGAELGKTFQVDDAIEAYGASTKSLLANPNSYSLLGWQYYLIGEPNDAIENFDTAILRDPQDAIHYYYKGFLFSQLNDPSAETLLLSSMAKDPYNNPRIYHTYTEFLLKNDRIDDARIILDRVLPEYSQEVINKRSGTPLFARDVALVHWQRAKIAMLDNDSELAKKHVEITLNLRADYSPALRLKQELYN